MHMLRAKLNAIIKLEHMGSPDGPYSLSLSLTVIFFLYRRTLHEGKS